MPMRRALAALAGVALLAGLTRPASAAGNSDKTKRQEQIGQQISSLKDQVDEASNQETALLGQIDTSRAKLADLTGRVRDLDGQVRIGERDLAAAERRLVQHDKALGSAMAHYDAV